MCTLCTCAHSITYNRFISCLLMCFRLFSTYIHSANRQPPPEQFSMFPLRVSPSSLLHGHLLHLSIASIAHPWCFLTGLLFCRVTKVNGRRDAKSLLQRRRNQRRSFTGADFMNNDPERLRHGRSLKRVEFKLYQPSGAIEARNSQDRGSTGAAESSRQEMEDL